MSPQKNHHQTNSNTYFVQPQTSKIAKREIERLGFQSRMLAAGMGGVMPEQPDLEIFQHVLDLGCGTGDWLIEAAKACASMSSLVGVDINPQMVAYAQAQADEQQVSERIRFQIGDVLGALPFEANYFDLVNQRLGQSYVRIWEWPLLISECQRVCKPGGTLRLTEVEAVPKTTSSAVSQLGQCLLTAFYKAGSSFSPENHGLTSHLARLLQAGGLQNVQTHAHILNYRGATEEGERFAHGLTQFFQNTLPFVQKWTQVPDTYEEIYRQAISDMHKPDFAVTWGIFTSWGVKPESISTLHQPG